MRKFKVRKQIRNLYFITAIGSLQIAGASWVALLALRGFSIVQIGILESIFHVVSMCFEIPSGVVADVFGRRKTMIISQYLTLISGTFMILSNSFWTVALAIGLSALSYNFSSGTREALAYDSLKKADREAQYEKFASTEMMLYRISNSTATLCAGLALFLGYRIAYGIDLAVGLVTLIFAYRLTEVPANEKRCEDPILVQLQNCVKDSFAFLRENRKTRGIIFVNALIGSVATLMLFFLQAKLPEVGLKPALLGPALFVMGLGAAFGGKAVSLFTGRKYKSIVVFSITGIIVAVFTLFTGNPYVICAGGFLAAFSDDFLEVRTDILLNSMIPSEQRATLVSVCSFAFSVVMIVLSPIMGWFFS